MPATAIDTIIENQHESGTKELQKILDAVENLKQETAKLQYRSRSLEHTLNDPRASEFIYHEICSSENSIPIITVRTETNETALVAVDIKFPIGSVEEISEFDQNLKNDEYKQNAVSIFFFILLIPVSTIYCFIQKVRFFQYIFGDNEPENKREIVSMIIHRMIRPEVLASFTWTGKSNKSKKSTHLKDLKIYTT